MVLLAEGEEIKTNLMGEEFIGFLCSTSVTSIAHRILHVSADSTFTISLTLTKKPLKIMERSITFSLPGAQTDELLSRLVFAELNDLMKD